MLRFFFRRRFGAFSGRACLHSLQQGDVYCQLLVGQVRKHALLDYQLLGQDTCNYLEIFNRLLDSSDSDYTRAVLLEVGSKLLDKLGLKLVARTGTAATTVAVARNTALEILLAQCVAPSNVGKYILCSPY